MVFLIKAFLFIIFIIFAVAGMCEFIYILKMLLFFPKTRTVNYSLIVLKNGYALRQMNYIWQKIKWHGDTFAVGIIAIADGIDAVEYNECQNFVKGKNIVLFRNNDLCLLK